MGDDKGLYEMIAENIKKERNRLCISQMELAEKAGISIDTVKSVERGRRAMSLDTYLRIVKALDTTPFNLMNVGQPDSYLYRLAHMMKHCKRNEVDFILFIVEQLIKGQECYLKPETV